MYSTSEKNTATLIHLSALTQYFCPFGNYIFPIIIWSAKKNDSEFIDFNGKQTLNFQLSIFLYTLLLGLVAIPILLFTLFKNIRFDEWSHSCNSYFENIHLADSNGALIFAIIAIVLLVFLKVFEFILIVYAAVRASNGEEYKYPLSISFFK